MSLIAIVSCMISLNIIYFATEQHSNYVHSESFVQLATRPPVKEQILKDLRQITEVGRCNTSKTGNTCEIRVECNEILRAKLPISHPNASILMYLLSTIRVG